MKIDYAIIGSDLNPLYLDFWPIISKVWKKYLNITPVLGLICDEDSDLISDEYGMVKKFKSIDGVNTALQSQIVRLYLPKLLNGNVIISDIDMLPMSKKYFVDYVSNFDDNKFYVMSSDHQECLMHQQYPMCYNLSNTENFIRIFGLDTNWENFVKELNEMNLGWTTDQNFLYKKINEEIKINQDGVVLLNRGWNPMAFYRIDRERWTYDPKLVSEGHYIDSHLLRPYNDNKNEINKLINFLNYE